MDALEQSPVARPGEVERMRLRAHPPLFVADWIGALFLHYEIDAGQLQRFVPYKLDVWEGRAFVSLVAFTMRGMRFAKCGALGKWICRPIATHEFLNLRTYVRHGDDAGICFLTEWLPNCLSLFLGPIVYALPYRYAKICYSGNKTQLRGCVSAKSGCFCYEGELGDGGFAPCMPGSLDKFLVERYVAFNAGHFSATRPCGARRAFHVWHDAWPQIRADVRVIEDSLLRNAAPWWHHTRFVGANYSPGVHDVQMSAPRKMRESLMEKLN